MEFFMEVKTLNGNLNIIGKNFKKYRKLKKMSQPEICRKLVSKKKTNIMC